MRITKSLLISLLIHLLIALFLVWNFQKIVLPPHKTEQSISLNLSHFVPPPKPKIIQPTIPLPKPNIQPKKILQDKKKRLFVAKKSNKENNITKIVPKIQKTIKKKVAKKRIVKKKKRYKKVKKRPKISKDPLANALMASLSPSRPKARQNTSTRLISRLYGKSFAHFSSSQKKFIKQNLSSIHRITQNTLSQRGYPDVASYTQQSGTNIVSFFLHPNGNISKLRLKKAIGYQALDQNTLEVIRIAYKDYPLPKEKTKIIFYVKYMM